MSLLWIAALLYFLAVLLAFVDLFLPSGGALLILGVISAVASVLCAFQQGAMAGSVLLLVVLATIPAFGFLAIRVWPNTPIGRRVIMRPKKPTSKEADAAKSQQLEIDALIGTVLVADADLMPSGVIVANGKSLSAMAETGFVEAGQRCEIIGYRERQFIVRLSTSPVSPLASQVGDAGGTEKTATPGAAPFASDSIEVAELTDASTRDGSLLDVPAERFGLDFLDAESPDKDEKKPE